MNADQYEYLVIRPKFQKDNELEDCFNEQGAGGWILVALLPEPVAKDVPYLAVFYRPKLKPEV